MDRSVHQATTELIYSWLLNLYIILTIVFSISRVCFCGCGWLLSPDRGVWWSIANLLTGERPDFLAIQLSLASGPESQEVGPNHWA